MKYAAKFIYLHFVYIFFFISMFNFKDKTLKISRNTAGNTIHIYDLDTQKSHDVMYLSVCFYLTDHYINVNLNLLEHMIL